MRSVVEGARQMQLTAMMSLLVIIGLRTRIASCKTRGFTADANLRGSRQIHHALQFNSIYIMLYRQYNRILGK